MRQLEGRVAVVTGAGEGIGRGIARRFAREGAAVLVAELNADSGQAVAEELSQEFQARAQFLQVDVRDKQQVEGMIAAAVQHFGRLDILVNNAWGGGSFRRGEHKTDEEMNYGLAINLWAGFWSMKAALPYMRAQNWGRIINLCSINGVNAHTGTLEYNVGKEALRALTRTLAREWAPHQICANVICPAASTKAVWRLLEQSPSLLQAASAPPMGRIGDPEADIAGVAVFLASEDARYVTGNTIFADGGAHINGAGWSVELPE
jgi:NAD(P)-dependent dehydrogenase (short-subunit alcohol dehydrogenase family)